MVGRLGAAAAIAAAVVSGCVASAAAEPNAGPSWMIFSGGDLWRQGGFLHGGIVYAPRGLDNDGPLFKLLLAGGQYTYVSGALGNADVTGRELTAQFLPGWRFKSGVVEIKLYAGLNLQDHRLSPDDPSSALRGTDVGARAAFELWAEPTANMMIAADGSISTIEKSYSIRGAAGLRVFDLFYTGPEIAAFATGDYQQRRIGLHVTSFRFDRWEWSAGTGWAFDTDDHDGPYIRLGVLTKF
jgi:hypothetical protein